MLFKESLNIDLEEIKQYLSVSQNGSFAKIRPHIAAAEILYIKDLLGEVLFNKLDEWYNSEESGSTSSSVSASVSVSTSTQVESNAALAAILPMLQRVLINFAYYIGADEYSLHITDAGMQIVTDETHKTAFQWQIEAVKSSWLNKAYLFSDVLLVYLESHKADYPSWVSSDSFTETMDSLLNTTKLFNDAFHIRNSRRLFLALKPIIRSIESKYAAYTLSQEYYDSLLVLLKTSALKAEDSIILKKIRPAIAHLAMAEAITRFSIDVFPEGVYSNLVSSFGSVTAKNPAGKLDKAVAIEKLQAEGLAEMQGVQIYLDANASASKYKTYFDSSRYVDPSITVNRSEFKNSADKGICLL